jgi:macrodomain Ter protein organizer (MatP/YcbG family)
MASKSFVASVQDNAMKCACQAKWKRIMNGALASTRQKSIGATIVGIIHRKIAEEPCIHM